MLDRTKNNKNKLLLAPGKKFFTPWNIGIVIIVLGIIYMFSFLLQSPPPNKIVIASGSSSSMYYAIAKKYKRYMKRFGIEVEIVKTTGSVENLQLVNDKKSKVSIALVQSGIVSEKNQNLYALCSLYREPLWVFYRGNKTLKYLYQLKGKRIAVGLKGSGTLYVALRLLAENGITSNNDKTKFFHLGYTQAGKALKKGQVDVAIFTASVQASYIQNLLHNKNISLMSFRRSESYIRRYHYLSQVKVSEGLLSLRANMPAQETTLLAPTATILVKKSIHPLLVTPLLKTMQYIHTKGNLIDMPKTFPSYKYVDLPLMPKAKQFLQNGASFLDTLIPYQIVTKIHQIKLLIIPLLTLLIPIFKLFLPIYRWQLRRRILRWYGVLRVTNRKLVDEVEEEELLGELKKLGAMEKQLGKLKVPLLQMPAYCRLYTDIAHSKKRLKQRLRSYLKKKERKNRQERNHTLKIG